jgi:uncharacterized protein (TIRG00374 family)
MISWLWKQRKTLIGLVMSAGAAYYVLRRVDWHAMASLKTDFHFEYLALFFLAYIFMYAAFSLRWHMMNERAGSYAASFAATVLASGGNALLPARGGDILRMLYYKQKTGQPVTVSAVRAVLEKGMDLPVLLSTVLITYSAFQKDLRILMVPLAMLVVILAAVVFIQMRPDILNAVIARLEKFFRKDTQDRSGVRYMPSFPYLWRTFGVTIFMWYVPVALSYGAFLLFLGIEPDLTAVLVLIMFGALGVAVPSAPSGLGVFHASMASAFEILGHGWEKGVLYATILHALLNLPLAAAALSVYFADYDRAGKSGKSEG